MVFYYTTSDGHLVYKGRDKFQNETLIKFAWEEDVWFHVEDLSSAHVYFRLNKGENWQMISKQNLQEVCQLLKENSIEGCKKAKVDIIYTPARNLNKSPEMEVGSVNFKNDKLVKKIRNIQRQKVILKTIEKTEKWLEPNLQQQLLKHEQQLARQKFKQKKQAQKEKKIEEEKQREEVAKRDYKLMQVEEFMTSNQHKNDDDDDFM